MTNACVAPTAVVPQPVERFVHPLVRVLEEVAAYYGLTVEKLKGDDRSPYVCEARAMFCVFARQLGYSWGILGGQLNRDHSTIVYIHKRLVTDLATCADRTAYNGIKARLTALNLL